MIFSLLSCIKTILYLNIKKLRQIIIHRLHTYLLHITQNNNAIYENNLNVDRKTLETGDV